MGPLRNANATRLLASAANSGSNLIFRLGIGVSQTRNHTQTNGKDANRQRSQEERPARSMGHRDIAATMLYLKGVESKDAPAKVNAGSLAAYAVGEGAIRLASEVAANFAESQEFGDLFLEFVEITQFKSCGVAIVQIHDQDPSSACYAWKQKSLNAQLLKLLADLHGSFKFVL